MDEQLDPPPPAPAPVAPPPLVIGEEMLEPSPPAETRADFERGMSRIPLLSLAFIGANAVVFAWELSSGALNGEEEIVAAGALVRDRLLDGEFWRPLTAMFLHGGVGHLLGNCAMLYVLGMACEHAFGWGRTALLYFAAGLAGAIASVAMNPGPSVGASGAVFGLMGAVVVFLLKHSDRFYLRDKRVATVLIVWGLYQIATGFLTPMIDNFAHIGGAIGGAGLAAVLAPRIRSSAV